MENSVKNKHGQQMNEFKEQKPEIRDSVKKSGKQNSDAGFEIEKNENKSKIKCQIKESAQVTDESDSDKEDSTLIKTEETETPIQDLYKQPKTQITYNVPSGQFRPETGVFYLKLSHDFSDIGYQAKTNKSKLCQIKESAQVTDDSDTDNEDLVKIKTEETEEPIPSKTPIMDSSPSRSKKTREDDFDKDEWDDEEPLTPPSLYRPAPRPTSATQSSTLYRCSSSDNHETHISRMDKIIAQGNIPDVPRRKHLSSPHYLMLIHRMSSSGSSVSSSIPYRCSSSDNHETQISGMDEMKHTHRKSSSGKGEMEHSYGNCFSGMEEMKHTHRKSSSGMKKKLQVNTAIHLTDSEVSLLPYRCSSSDNNEIQISRMDKIIAQGNIPDVPRRNRPAPPPPDLLE